MFYGDTDTEDIHNTIPASVTLQDDHELFVVRDYHRDEVPAEYYNNPEEYYRLKFKKRGYDVKLQPYFRSAY